MLLLRQHRSENLKMRMDRLQTVILEDIEAHDRLNAKVAKLCHQLTSMEDRLHHVEEDLPK